MGAWQLRPMRVEDVVAAERVKATSFHELDRRERRHGAPEPVLRDPARARLWVERTTSLVRTDPAGCWVVEDDTGLVGIATSFTRGPLWVLATYAVVPGRQGAGVGRPLLDAALAHGREAPRWMLASSSDPRAVRRYRLAGLSLHPQLAATGEVDRTALPTTPGVREATAADRALMDGVDVATRGVAHGDHHDLLARTGRPLVLDTTAGRGYVCTSRGRVAALAATTTEAATTLLWAALAEADGPVTLAHVTTANEWALDVALAARLEVRTDGYLGVRGTAPPAPYLHHGALL